MTKAPVVLDIKIPDEIIPKKDLMKAQVKERMEIEVFQKEVSHFTKIRNDEDLAAVSKTKALLMDRLKVWQGRFKPIVKAIKVVVSMVQDVEKDVSAEYAAPIAACDRLMTEYAVEKRQKALKAQAEQEEAARKLEEKRQALYDKAKKATPQMQSKLLDKVVDLEEEAEELLDNAKDDGRVKTDEFTTRVTLKCRIVDKDALLIYIAASLNPKFKGDRLDPLATINETQLHALMRLKEITMETGADWLPGVEVYEDVTSVRNRS